LFELLGFVCVAACFVCASFGLLSLCVSVSRSDLFPFFLEKGYVNPPLWVLFLCTSMFFCGKYSCPLNMKILPSDFYFYFCMSISLRVHANVCNPPPLVFCLTASELGAVRNRLTLQETDRQRDRQTERQRMRDGRKPGNV